ncbi:glycyl-radical enzyme activating protein [Fusibacter ferrireducens]|uniref:Glycyl-radical enzyme activating protein n=1 Tax=Fusibacter ferrireducens TaxID=2785058 RepID=A0ABR9ZX65_9FIRM|nr:glycyl-radical enzyme activating protein [Fusibacter ferrireducens]MBF4694455.1 glycyl-radical enzyme activating protein [Fusibacter ferrireducens]
MTINLQKTAPIFNIQSFCLHDGPGIRTTVFVKGCPLRCAWCQNPESQQCSPQLMVYSAKCINCRACVDQCPNGAIEFMNDSARQPFTDRTLCSDCGRCIQTCPTGARELVGAHMSVSEVFQKVEAEHIFYLESGGGLTISGGEALMHPEFTHALCHLSQENKIHTALETCGFASSEVIDYVFKHVDLALYDIKHMNTTTHKKYTGVPNELILNNLKFISNELHKPVIVRIPIIPGFNSSYENIESTARFIKKQLHQEVEVNLLPYHRLGNSKRESLNLPEAPQIEIPSTELLLSLSEIMASYGITVKIGG